MPKKILVIEDDIAIRELLVELLISEGYDVTSAVNGEEGLTRLRNDSLPDVILMDLMMPVMDGYGFRTEQLKNSKWSSIPTIVMSAEAQAREKLKPYHVNDFLSKPVELDTILSTIAKYI